MFGKKKTDTAAVENAVSQGVSYEITLADRARRSERRAWTVAMCAVLMSVLLAGGYLLFLPLKERVPYLVMADPYTGSATVARLRGNFGDRDVTTEEAINKSNVAQFVLARESYDSGLIGQRNWRTTLSMAGPAVAPDYQNLHNQANPQRPYRIYGASRSLHIRITSIVLIGGGQGKRPNGATVRFQRSIFDKTTGRSQPLDNKIATLEFTYDPELRLADEDRLLNPLGFRVLNYRVDNDFAPTPNAPADVPMGTDPQAQAQASAAVAPMPGQPGEPAYPAGTTDPSGQALPPGPANNGALPPQPAEQTGYAPAQGGVGR
ncbi:virB8 family protein [Stenotrophomonas sp. NPDC077659]|uniref:virB8 family protein n=1 Tax=Stenotrophomonas sp. NPDC077659 TaxID=3390694 RepID=UPI003D050BD6